MTTPAPEPAAQASTTPPTSSPVASAGPVTRLEHEVAGWFGKHAGPAETEAGHAAAGANSAIIEHAPKALRIVASIVEAAQLVDPADAALFAAFETRLLPEAVDLAEAFTGAISRELARIKL